jgi:hypothetical protein
MYVFGCRLSFITIIIVIIIIILLSSFIILKLSNAAVCRCYFSTIVTLVNKVFKLP